MEKTFAGIPEEFANKETAKIWLQSINYDGTSTWGKGANNGFEAFLDAAENMELYDIETDSEVYLEGIHMLENAPEFNSPEDMYQWTYNNTVQLLKDKKFLTFFGGEHSISIGIIKAFYEQFEDLTVLQIDAHADQRPQYGGTPYNHACAVYDAGQNCNLLQVGIRSMDVDEKQFMDRRKTWYGHEIAGSLDWIPEVVSKMTDNVYITVDLDAFDSSIMPATGTPEPGGMNWEQVIGIIRKTFAVRNIVGFDIVELAPIKGMKAPQFLAAKLYYKMLSYKFKN
ncbi:agmatinase [Portibacter lacus]|uniref:Agmatinase n=1 Tax=Portibacter lacus TaxID=1099794 RepID=A0AA37SPU1_9BACT|nr:agmatinase [Portibacter lacus]GLR16944.1 agmatinase [Portibacter lacus]